MVFLQPICSTTISPTARRLRPICPTAYSCYWPGSHWHISMKLFSNPLKEKKILQRIYFGIFSSRCVYMVVLLSCSVRASINLVSSGKPIHGSRPHFMEATCLLHLQSFSLFFFFFFFFNVQFVKFLRFFFHSVNMETKISKR